MHNKILVVDDAELNRDLLQDILEDEYSIEMAEDGEQAIEKIRQMADELNVILLDLQMPKMDGFDVLREMNHNGWMEHIPVLIISGENSVKAESLCFELGVSDFIKKPFEPKLIKRRVKNIADLFVYKKRLEDKVEQQTETLRRQNNLLMQQAEQLQEMNRKIIEVLGDVVEYRNLESGEHIHRVKNFTEILAYHAMREFPEYGLKEEDVVRIVASSPLHDIGKISIPDSILLKPGRLSNEEFACMKSHTLRGCDILDRVEGIWDDEAYRQDSYDICRYHHERYDGNGYPDGLKGEEIPLSAQIVSIADVYDALVSERVYKKPFSKDKAFQMILNGECGMFSPRLLECFQNARAELEALVDSNRREQKKEEQTIEINVE